MPRLNCNIRGVYVLVLETDGFEFLIDPADLWKPPRVLVRRGYIAAEIWLDETDVSFLKPSRFTVRDQTHILELVRDNLDDLLLWWATLKNDLRRGRLERNVLVE